MTSTSCGAALCRRLSKCGVNSRQISRAKLCESAISPAKGRSFSSSPTARCSESPTGWTRMGTLPEARPAAVAVNSISSSTPIVANTSRVIEFRKVR